MNEGPTAHNRPPQKLAASFGCRIGWSQSPWLSTPSKYRGTPVTPEQEWAVVSRSGVARYKITGSYGGNGLL